MSPLKSKSGFTLIEVVIIIVVLGILAAVAIPKYQDISADAREAACRGSLGGLRSGITIYYANKAVKTGTAEWPSLDSISTVGVVMEQEIPKNPYCPNDNAPDSIVLADPTVNKGDQVGTRGGWVYKESTGELWANTNVAGENLW